MNFVALTIPPVFVSAACGSAASVLLCTPFDVVKNYWQASPALNHQRTSTSTRQIVREIFQKHGLRGFWKGTPVALAYVIPNTGLFFTIYERLRREGFSAPLAAAQGRVVAVMIFSPVDLIRTRLQTRLDLDAISETRRIFSQEKFTTLWRGAPPALLRDVPFSMIYFSLYEHIKSRLPEDSSWKKFPITLINGSTSAAIACLLTHPFDLAKTQIQNSAGSQMHTTWTALGALKNEYGYLGLLTIGLAPRLAKVMPASGIMIATYELTKSLFS